MAEDELRQAIREWIRLDKEMALLQLEIGKRKLEKKKNTQYLLTVMKRHEIDCFNIQGGDLVMKTRTVKKPIGKKKMLSLLTEYYQGNVDIATELNNFLMQHRDVEEKNVLVQKRAKTETLAPAQAETKP
jgi:hypothetical protein